jgi:hypothetical protein
VLGVAADSDPETVAQAYRRLAWETHPDVSSDPDAADRFATVVGAYRVLSARTREPTGGEPVHAAVPLRIWVAQAGADDRKHGRIARLEASPSSFARPGQREPIVAGPVMVRASWPYQVFDVPEGGDG